MATRISPAHDWPWPLAVAVALLVCAGIGLLQGTIITRIGLPSFVVTLAGLLFWQGVLLKILGSGGSQPINNTGHQRHRQPRNLTPTVGWIVMLVLVGLYGAMVWRRDSKRRKAGLVAPPPRVTLLKIAGALAAGVALRAALQHRTAASSCRSGAYPGWCCWCWACS